MRSQGNAFQDGTLLDTSTPRLHEHFFGAQRECDASHIRVQPIEQVVEGALNEREKYWIRELRAVFPYGLNMRLDLKGLVDNRSIEMLFNPIKPKSNRRKSKQRRGKKEPVQPDQFLDSVQAFYGNAQWQHKVRCEINKLRKRDNQALARKIHDCLFEPNRWSAGLISVCQDLLDTRLNPPMFDSLVKKKKLKIELFCRLNFLNPGFDMLGLGTIFRSEEVQKLLPQPISPFVPLHASYPVITFTHTQPIRNRVFNYKKATKLLRGTFWEEINHTTCACRPAGDFVHPKLGHVLTGDLNLVRNEHLKFILRKGPKYREPRPVDWDEVRGELGRGIAATIEKWSKLEDIKEEKWDDWKKKVLKLTEDRIAKCAKAARHESRSVFDDPAVNADLAVLQDRFVLFPTDKAENNVLIVCKHFYLKCLVEELFNKDTEVCPYEDQIGESEDSIVSKVIAEMPTEAGPIPDVHRSLAGMYWTGKMHKETPGRRFVAASNNCVTKNCPTFCLVV
jgi:hypothetical protein